MTRTLLSTALLVSLGATGTPGAQSPAGSITLRVLTYNIHHGEGTDGQFDLARLAGVIMNLEPDLVALQEVDQGTERSGGVLQLTELGRLTGMHAVFGKAMDFEGGEYGVGVLSRWPIARAANHALLRPPTDREQRTALTVDVLLGERGRVVRFTSTHLDQSRDVAGRIAQADHLNELLAPGDDTPSILAGDLNSRADAEVMQRLGERWTDAFVEPPPADPTARRRYRVDHVVARPAGRWRTIESRVVDAPLVSDHRPVLVVLEWID